MITEVFERLLYEEESTTLDFKRDQYRFAKATEEEKSELLKDILGFVNAWRRSEAYILVGVEDVRGGRGNVVGIPHSDHLDDHSLQQFVNNLTNRPVLFNYEAFGFEGKQVGIIRIGQQTRPIYLKRDYGKLQLEKVYVRRGSSTDPTKPASLDEVARMGQSFVAEQAELVVEFADLNSDSSLGNRISWDAELWEFPSFESIPSYSPPSLSQLGLAAHEVFEPWNQPNRQFYRETAVYEFTRRLYRPARLLIKNSGQFAAKNVRAEITAPTNVGVVVIDSSDFPDRPKRTVDFPSNTITRGFRPAFRRDPGEVIIDKSHDQFKIGIECGDLQPGRSIKSDKFFIGKGRSGEFVFTGRLLAENLPDPKSFILSISTKITNKSVTLDELLDLSESDTSTD